MDRTAPRVPAGRDLSLLADYPGSLAEDLGEANNVAAAHPEKVAAMMAKLTEIVRVVESDESRRFAGEIETLNGHLNEILKMPDVAQRFYDQAFIPGGSDPEAFTQLLRREYARWEPIVKATGVQLEM